MGKSTNAGNWLGKGSHLPRWFHVYPRFVGGKVQERFDPLSKPQNYGWHIARYQFCQPFVSGKIVLDIACGTGYGSSMLSSSGASLVIGADLSINAVKYAQEHFQTDRVYWVVMDGRALGFGPDTFDVIVSLETIEHISDYRRFLRELARILRPGGVLLLSTPNKTWHEASGLPPNPYHIYEFTPLELKEILTTYFKEVTLLGQDVSPAGRRRISEWENTIKENFRSQPACLRFIIEHLRPVAQLVPSAVRDFFMHRCLGVPRFVFLPEDTVISEDLSVSGRVIVAVCRK